MPAAIWLARRSCRLVEDHNLRNECPRVADVRQSAISAKRGEVLPDVTEKIRLVKALRKGSWDQACLTKSRKRPVPQPTSSSLNRRWWRPVGAINHQLFYSEIGNLVVKIHRIRDISFKRDSPPIGVLERLDSILLPGGSVVESASYCYLRT